MSIEREKIKRVQDQVQGSALGTGHKEALDDMLLATYKATNGTPDKMQALTEAVASLGVCLARDAIHRREDFANILDAGLEKHKKDCPLTRRDAGAGDPEIEADLKSGTFKAKGKAAMIPITKIILACIVGGVVLAAIRQMSNLSDEIRDLKTAVQYRK